MEDGDVIDVMVEQTADTWSGRATGRATGRASVPQGWTAVWCPSAAAACLLSTAQSNSRPAAVHGHAVGMYVAAGGAESTSAARSAAQLECVALTRQRGCSPAAEEPAGRRSSGFLDYSRADWVALCAQGAEKLVLKVVVVVQ